MLFVFMLLLSIDVQYLSISNTYKMQRTTKYILYITLYYTKIPNNCVLINIY